MQRQQSFLQPSLPPYWLSLGCQISWAFIASQMKANYNGIFWLLVLKTVTFWQGWARSIGEASPISILIFQKVEEASPISISIFQKVEEDSPISILIFQKDLDPTQLDFCRDIIPLEISRPYLLSGERLAHPHTHPHNHLTHFKLFKP